LVVRGGGVEGDAGFIDYAIGGTRGGSGGC